MARPDLASREVVPPDRTGGDSPPSTLAPLLGRTGALLMREPFDVAASYARNFNEGKGMWTLADGRLTGASIPADQHDAGVSHLGRHHDAAIQVVFRFDGAKQIKVNFIKRNAVNEREHVSQVRVSSTTLAIYAQTGIGPTTVNRLMADTRVSLQNGLWYTLLVEVSGKQMAAQLDTGASVRGMDDVVDVDKESFTLDVGGSTASFDEVVMWTLVPR